MIRKLILPALAVLLLAGCATGYTYRATSGDYYYGQPGVIYRDYYGGYYPYSWYGSYGYGYRYPYGYYGRYPGRYYGHPRYPHYPRPGNDNDGGQASQPDRPTPPWRDLDRIGHEARPDVPRSDGLRMRPVRPQVAPAPVQRTAPVQRSAPRVRSERRGSAMSEMIRRAQPNRDVRPTNEE